MALVDVLFDFINVMQLKVDFNEEESYVHFFTDFDGFFEGEVVCVDCFWELFMVVKDFGFFKETISDFGLSKVFLSILDFSVGVLDEFVEGLLDLHDGVKDLNFF